MVIKQFLFNFENYSFNYNVNADGLYLFYMIFVYAG